MIALTKEKDNKYDNHCQEDFVWKVGNRAPDPQIENALPPEKKHTHTHAHTQFIMQWSQKGRDDGVMRCQVAVWRKNVVRLVVW